jgi:TonB family protein
MNTRLILPGMIALVFHVFFFFGLNGKALPAVVEPDAKAPDSRPTVSLDQDDWVSDPAPPDEFPGAARGGPVAPRPVDIPVVNRPDDAITISPLPPIQGDHGTTVIAADWERPRKNGRNSASDAVDMGRLDRTPRTRSQPAPVYPANLLVEGVEGTVVVEFLVDLEGNVHAPVVLRASRADFIEPALRAIARWKFEPGYCGGRKVRFRMSVPLVFTIEGR